MIEKDIKNLLLRLRFPIAVVIVIWLVHFYNLYNNNVLGFYGVYPRELDGLIGIFTAPLIHSMRGGFGHIISNTFPLFFLMGMMMIFYRRVAIPAFVIIYLLTGFMVWLFARPVYHIGASGVVYGLVSFVFWSGVFRQNLRSIILALIVTVLYSSYFLGISPNQDGVSWESHLFGAIAGIFASFLFKEVLEHDEIKEESEPYILDEEIYYLPRDTFDKTLMQRAQEEELKKRESGWTSDHTM